MAYTHELIQRATVPASGTTTIVFESVPQTYSDLLFCLSLRTDRTAQEVDNIKISFNGSTTTYSAREFYTNGSAVFFATFTTQRSGLADASLSTASIFSNTEIYIPKYTGTDYKSWFGSAITEHNATQSAYSEAIAGLWSTGSAITSVSFAPQDGTLFLQYSSASLYGIKNS